MSTPPAKPARSDFVLPASAIGAALAAHLPGTRLIGASPLKGGVSASVYRLDVAADAGAPYTLVLRVHGPHHNGHPAALEAYILRAVSALGVCAPRVRALDESRVHIPYPFLILEHLDGETAAPTRADDTRLVRMADALAQIHAAPVDQLPALPSRIDPLPELFDYLPREAEFDALRDGLSKLSNTQYTGRAALLHGDFWPGNLLWQGDQLTGILDWEDAACGDPLSDVACTALELRYVTGPDGAQRFLDAYHALRPLDPRRLALWQIYVAAAGQHSMGAWGLDAAREAHMRANALDVIREAGALLM